MILYQNVDSGEHMREMKGRRGKLAEEEMRKRQRQQEREAPKVHRSLGGGGQVKAILGGVALSSGFFPGCSVAVQRNRKF